MGYFRCDYSGDRWWNTVWPVDTTLETPELVHEFDQVLSDFREDFPSLDHAKRFCREHARRSEDDEYNLYLELEHGLYWFRFRFYRGDYNLYLYCYSKAALGAGGDAR